MELGVGLPAVVPGASADLILRWARDADAATFSSLGVHDRLAWDGFECLGVLNAAAAVTDRIRLASLVLIAPLRPAMLIASQAAAIQRLSEGRLTLGVGIGPRRDDYEAAGSAFGTRGRRLEAQLHEFREVWDKGLDRPGLLVGGGGDPALDRMARHADGYVHGGGPARAFKSAADRALAAWYDAGRPGRPRPAAPRLVRRRPARPSPPGRHRLLRPRRQGRRRPRIPPPLLPLRGALRGADRGRHPHQRRGHRRTGRRLRGGGLRRACALPDRRLHRAAPLAGGAVRQGTGS